jgi:FKBP-type peptidyl-prolyl cis-trans isomerase 2
LDAETQLGLGYFTTITGFNEALKGLSTRTSRVVHVAAEDAYTLPGNEGHPLYGDDIVFLIQVEAVDDLPCGSTVSEGGCDDLPS